MNREFIQYITDVKEAVLRTDELSSPFTLEDSHEVLRSIAGIGAAVRDEIIRVFGADEQMDDESYNAVMGLEKLLVSLRGTERLRLAALNEFDVITAGAVS